MAEVRTKESQKAPVKTLNRAQNMAQRIRTGVKVTEKQAVDAAQSREESYYAHNADSLESKVKNSADTAVRQTGKATHKVAEKGKEKVEEKAKDAIQRYRQKKAEQNVLTRQKRRYAIRRQSHLRIRSRLPESNLSKRRSRRFAPPNRLPKLRSKPQKKQPKPLKKPQRQLRKRQKKPHKQPEPRQRRRQKQQR